MTTRPRPSGRPLADRPASASPQARERAPRPAVQWATIKRQYPQAVVLLRLGDGYATYDQDARTIQRVCGVAWTLTANGTERADVPAHAIEQYTTQLVKAGCKVALCEPTSAAGREARADE